jgi:hypothetical protein
MGRPQKGVPYVIYYKRRFINMKYQTNDLEDIYIHDTSLDQFGYQDDECIFIVSCFAVKSSCKVNPHPHAMQVKEALIRFKNITFKEMCYKGYKHYNSNDEIIDVVLDRYIDVDEIDGEISNIIDLCPELYSCNRLDGGDYVFTMLCERDVIQFIVSFESVSIQWNAFEGKAYLMNK